MTTSVTPTNIIAPTDSLTTTDVTFSGGSAGGVTPSLLDQLTIMEVTLGESLLTPGLQTVVRCHNYLHNLSRPGGKPKNLNAFKNSRVHIKLERKLLQMFGLQSRLDVSQTIYRLERRTLVNDNIEQFTLHACDQSLLDDAVTLVSQPFGCTLPSSVVREVLQSCAGVKELDIEPCSNKRSYHADNIHPFQIVAAQANAALAVGNDPSFLHYMTYERLGTHKFRSLYSLTQQSPVIEFYYDQTGMASLNGKPSGYNNPFGIMRHSFPCDFDMLSDLLNGLDETGKNINSLITFNPVLKTVRLFGSQTYGCGIGSGDVKNITNNLGSAKDQAMCPDYSQQYVLLRQARMSLLEQNKIALRLTVPFCPLLNVGKIIKVNLYNKEDQSYFNYGAGDYLICSLMHNIKYGGFATTTLDCVTKSVGGGLSAKDDVRLSGIKLK